METRESNYRAALDVVRAVLEELHQVAVLLLHLLLRQRVHGFSANRIWNGTSGDLQHSC